MSYTIAIAGKGGTGKTTISSLIIKLIKDKKLGSILAVDADPNSNLAESLGVEVKQTIGSILDDIAGDLKTVPQGMSKDRFIEYQVQTAVVESLGFDLLTMGRPEGPGCYCYVNNVLRNVVGRLSKDYQYVVVDNEAGLEHFSRRTTRACDTLVVVSDCTEPGLRAAKRISGLVKELNIKPKKSFLLINSCVKEIEKDRIKNLNLDYIGSIPLDKQVENLSISGASLLELKNDAVSIAALGKIGDKIWQLN